MKLHRLYNGTHLSVNNVLSRRYLFFHGQSKSKLNIIGSIPFTSLFSKSSAFSIEVEEVVGTDSIYVQSDGEHLGFLPRKFSILPGAISMIC